ncbi:retrotransposon protein, putative, ty1-copia subclass [Tanacetum coccineum]|uniref:Retrotransposon protein, putative, ty1-copia subclass n=1 Tax=Tanacetum coccineum TaxID=301880 RepID=A0ABQ5AIP8_9ASTR
MYFIEQRLPAAPAANSKAQVLLQRNVVYDAYNEHNMRKTVGELYAMLIEYEKSLPKKAETPQVMMIKGGKIQKSNKKSLKDKGKGKANGKGKDKQVYIPKPKNAKPSAKEHPDKDDTFHHCKEVGHCKRNCPTYLAELIKKKKQVGTASSSDVFIIELFSFPTKSWVYDTSCGTLICNTKHGLGGVRKLKQVEAIGSFDLVLPNSLMICLDNCHYAPSITRGAVSIHRLVENGFVQCFMDFGISVSKNKMTRKLFPHRPERVTGLLGIIHTDVCGPLRYVSRQGASYFITFNDDYSRYGYVYLLKHKHEVFETFKVFKNEVENQLGKTIKALRSDRGGEYISQEFKDYLKACGIVQQLTPPYTPQHNGVSERRNRTLLDMVRSMMNLTTLPLSFWDYALESATRILNMVPTKKVDKTPYELWYGKVPNLSYLKVWGCEALVKRDTPDKLQQRSVKCIFIGYPKETMGYYFYFPPENKIVVASYLDEDIYMVQPEGFVDPNHPRKVCKLQRSIYGLKQASRSWNKRFDEEIKRFGFDQNIDEPCVYQKASGSNVTFLILYVDDIIIIGNHIPSLQSVKDNFGKCFAMKDLGKAAFILGIKIYKDRLELEQKHQGASPPKEVKRMQNVPYASAVGSIMYAMTLPVQNINHSAFRSMFEREKLSGNNFNDWFRQLKLVLRVEKKMYVIEQPLPAAPAADSQAQVLSQWNAVYDAFNEVACLILGSMTPELHRQFENSSPYDMIKELKSMFEKQAGVDRFDVIQTFHACKQEEGKPVAAYVLQVKGYVDQLERLGYMLPHDLIVGLILNGLTKDFAGFVRSYNMHNMGKTIGELHAMLIEYEKGLLKKAKTPQVMMIKVGKIQKANTKLLKAKGKGKANGKGKDKQVYIPKPKNFKTSAKEHPAKDDTCHHCKEGFREARKLKQGALYLYVGNGVRAQVEAIGSYDLVLPNGLVICLENCHYAPSITRESAARILKMIPTKKDDKTPYELWYGKVHNLSYLKIWGCEALVKRDTPDKLQQRSVKYIFIGYPKETMGYYFYFTPENKIVVASEIPMEVEGFEPPQEEDIPICRSERTHRAPNRLSLNVEAVGGIVKGILMNP